MGYQLGHRCRICLIPGQTTMMRALVLLLVIQLAAVRANAIIKSHFAVHDRSEELMRVLSVVDISDRNMNSWWDQFSLSWAKYDVKVKDDPMLYCSSWEMLLKDLAELKSKVELVLTGVKAKEEQLAQIRDILENTELGGKSGLHCKEDPKQAICVALDGLDKKAAEERGRIMAEIKMVTDEITKVETYPCDCTYNDWANNWGSCSVTCDVGVKKETRQIKWNKRNGGKDCESKDAKRTGDCNDGCCPKDCEWDQWSSWTACPEKMTCEQQYERAHRSILVEHECSERGGRSCVGETEKSRECNILDMKNKIIAEKDKENKRLANEIKGLKEGCKVEAEWTPPPMVGKGWCVTNKGGYPPFSFKNVSVGPATVKGCYEICKSESGCKSFSFTRANNSPKCGLYKGGPFTRTHGSKDATCYNMP